MVFPPRTSDALTEERIASLYGISREAVSPIVFYDPALGCKITFERQVSSGSSEDRDVYGAQQHMPLAALEVDI